MPAKRGHAEQDERGSRREGAMTAVSAAQSAIRQIADITGKRPEGVTSVGPTDSGWLVGVEVLEDRHVPSSSDILGLYEVELDAEGELESYRRTRRYSRGRGDGAEAKGS